jgi:hypothetical protein
MRNFFNFSNAHNFFLSLIRKLKLPYVHFQVLLVQKNFTSALADGLKYEKSEWKNYPFFCEETIYTSNAFISSTVEMIIDIYIETGA